jgi:transposase InsO family protein
MQPTPRSSTFVKKGARDWQKCRDWEIFYSLKEAQVVIRAWRDHYNRVRPHSSLGYRPPAPVTMETLAQQRSTPAIMQ